MGYFVDFLSIFIKNGLFSAIFELFSGKYWLNSFQFDKGVVQDLGSISGQFQVNYNQFHMNWLQNGFNLILGNKLGFNQIESGLGELALK